MRIDHNRKDENGNPAGGQSCGPGFAIAWQDGPCQDPDSPDCKGRNGAFLIEVLEACETRLHHYQDSKFECDENKNALIGVGDAIDALKSRLNRRKDAGTLGSHQVDEPKSETSQPPPDIGTVLPTYACHKKVQAFKIHSIGMPDADMVILSPDDGHAGHPVAVFGLYMEKHKPQIGGYYVRYADGHESYSPAKAFEEGYTPLGTPGISVGPAPSLGGETG